VEYNVKEDLKLSAFDLRRTTHGLRRKRKSIGFQVQGVSSRWFQVSGFRCQGREVL
jgi:hypothetical protein